MRYRYKITQESDLCSSAFAFELEARGSVDDAWSSCIIRDGFNTADAAAQAARDEIDTRVHGWVMYP